MESLELSVSQAFQIVAPLTNLCTVRVILARLKRVLLYATF